MTASSNNGAGVLFGKVALVTGASRGIGREVALALAAAGADVALIARSAAGLAEVASLLAESTKRQVITFAADVGNAGEVAAAVRATVAKFAHIDVAVVNAGVYTGSTFLETTDEEWRSTIETNIVGSVVTLREVGRVMCELRGGSIITLGSICGRIGGAGSAAYSLSKAATMQLTRALSVEWARYGVRLNSVCPGWISTDLNAPYSSDKVMKSALREIPLRRLGVPADVAPAVVFLASEASSYITGHDLVIDGGRSAR